MKKNINLKELFQKSNKCDEVEIKSRIKDITSLGELFFVNIFDSNYYYKGLTIMKNEIYPKPLIGNTIAINKIYYKFDETFTPRIFINAKICKDPENKEMGNLFTLNLFEKNLRETLLNFLEIKQELFSNIFIVYSINEDKYSLKLFLKNGLYIFQKKCEFLDYTLKLKDIIYINDYYIENNRIKLTPISLIEKLSEEKLFILLQEKKEIFQHYLWGKIIENDRKNEIIRIMDKDTNLLTLGKYDNDVKLGQYFIFSNYKIDENIIKLGDNKDNSYYSNQELYFSNKLALNFYTVIQFIFIDFKGPNRNYYNEISIENTSFTNKINNNKVEIVYKKVLYLNNKLIPVSISLIKDVFNKVSFYAKVLHGLLNKINVFVNYANNSSYYFEYLYYYFEEPKNILDQTKIIKCGEENYKITAYDNFDSNNRIRFNILNIPVQNDCIEHIKNCQSNSFFICEAFKNNGKSNIYGIFDIKNIIFNMSMKTQLNNIDLYYYNVGWIYDKLKNNIFEDDAVLEFLKENENIFKEINYKTFSCTLNIFNEITDSELKARFGILICYHFKQIIDKKKFRKLKAFRDIQNAIMKIELVKKELTNSQILRIFSYLLRAKIYFHNETEILLLSKEKDNSAYLLAQNFILEEIDNINEFSRLFQGYLQMDSYIMYNYKKESNSYSLSIEPIFIVKHHLKSNYEGFFLLEELNDNVLGWTEPYENVTIINEQYLFEKYKYKDPSNIQNESDLKDCAFGISIVLRHENNSHKKKNLNNCYIISPIYYCDNGEAIELKKEISKKDGGEDGIIIECLIIKNQETIISLARDFIYGELLDFKLFIQKDFTELMKRIDDIKKKLSESHNKKENTNGNQIDEGKKIEMRDTHNNNENDKKQLNVLAKKAIREKILKLGDEFYSIDVIREIVENAESNNSTHLLPLIFIEISKELKENENGNYI